MKKLRKHLLAPAAALACVVVASGTAPAGANYAPVTMWGSTGTANSQFNNPSGIDVGPDGSIYVADLGNHRIQKFDASGAFLTKWGKNGGDGTSGSANGEFNQPADVSVDASGDVWVADVFNHRVQRFSGSGAHELTFGVAGTDPGEMNLPSSVALDSAGNVYVTQFLNDRVDKYEPDGDYLLSMTPTTPITTAARVAVDADDFVYVSDVAIADRIVKFDPTGAQVDVWGSGGTGDGQFTSPGGIDFDAAGNVLIADAGVGRRVEIFQPDGTYLRKFGDSSVFTNVADVAVDAGGFVYTVDNTVNRVQKFGENALPDALIAKQGDLPVGGGVHNADGTDQTVTQKVKTGKSASYDIDIENDAVTGTDAITVTGDAGNNKFKVKYDDAGDVTAAVTGAGYVLAANPPGPIEDLTVKVKAKSSAKPGNKRTVLITATSGNDDTFVDAVKTVTKAK